MTENAPDDRWLLPDGVDELLPGQAWRLEMLRRDLLDLCRGWGYRLVMPPLVEFLDSLLIGTGNDLNLETFKLIDQQSGKTLGVRADMTPQVARIAARRLGGEAPSRLCFIGTVLRTRGDGLGGSRSPLQFGAELYGHAGVASDLEIIELMLTALAAAGVDRLHVDLGHVAVFRGLVRQTGLSAAAEADLFDMLQRKALPELRQRLPAFPLSPRDAATLLTLAELNGDADQVLSRARAAIGGGDDVRRALDDLTEIHEGLRARRPQLPVHLDLAELHGYHYHTGCVFAAYVPERGRQVARGGRYDGIGAAFDRPRPATGFSADLKTLIRLAEMPAEDAAAIYAPADAGRDGDAALDDEIAALRAAGEVVIRALPAADASPAALGCGRELYRDGDGWALRPVPSMTTTEECHGPS